MASRYWVGPTTGGTWNSTASWSATSGGASGASIPTSADDVFFSLNNTYTIANPTVTLNSLTVSAGNVTLSGSTANITINGTTSISVGATLNLTGSSAYHTFTGAFTNSGTFTASGWAYMYYTSTLNSSGTYNINNTNGYVYWGGNVNFTAAATINVRFILTENTSTAARTWKTAGSSITTAQGFLIRNGTAITITLQDNMTISGSSLSFNWAAGSTFALNNFVLTVTSISFNAGTMAFGTTGRVDMNSSTGSLTLGSGGTYTGTFYARTTSTITSGTRTVNCSPATSIPVSTTGTTGLVITNATGMGLSLSGNFTSVDLTSYTGTLSGGTRSVSGNFTIGTGVTVSNLGTTTFNGTSNFTTNGRTIGLGTIVVNGTSVTLVDALTMSSTSSITHTNGTLNMNGKNISVGSYTTGAGTKTLTFNSATLTLSGSGFFNSNPSGYTITVGTGAAISFTSASAKTFAGGGATYGFTISQNGVGALSITGSNTITTLNVNVNPTTLTFAAGTTNTITTLSPNGINGSVVTFNSDTPGSQATISIASGSYTLDYMMLQDINFTGAASKIFGVNAFNIDNTTGVDAPYADGFLAF